MKTRQTLSFILLFSGFLWVSCGSERAVWIEVKEHGEQKTAFAMTEGIARQLLETKEMDVNFSKTNEGGLITREMLRAVLEGRERSLTARDGDGSEAIVYARQLRTPGHQGTDRLVLETHKAGKQIFRIALPELEIEQANQESDEFVKMSFGWKALLPFLAKTGGAMYIKDYDDDTEVWIYVE